MNINDEMLSAFLDGALLETDMEQIRQQLQQDERLTERLAELAMVDSLVAHCYQHIDHKPMPAAVLQLLDEKGDRSSEVVAFPWWRQMQQQLQRHAAVVACLSLFAGFGLSQLTVTPGTVLANNDVLQLLDSVISGQSYPVNATEQLTPQLSFIDQQGDFCRYYLLQSSQLQTESIACRRQGQWQPQASFSVAHHSDGYLYQTATASGALDTVLDKLMAGPALSPAAEQNYLTSDLNN